MTKRDDNLNNFIICNCHVRWKKTAMIIAKALEDTSLEISAEDIGAMIKRLVSEKKLEARGDLDKWRESEIRLITNKPD